MISTAVLMMNVQAALLRMQTPTPARIGISGSTNKKFATNRQSSEF